MFCHSIYPDLRKWGGVTWPINTPGDLNPIGLDSPGLQAPPPLPQPCTVYTPVFLYVFFFKLVHRLFCAKLAVKDLCVDMRSGVEFV